MNVAHAWNTLLLVLASSALAVYLAAWLIIPAYLVAHWASERIHDARSRRAEAAADRRACAAIWAATHQRTEKKGEAA